KRLAQPEKPFAAARNVPTPHDGAVGFFTRGDVAIGGTPNRVGRKLCQIDHAWRRIGAAEGAEDHHDDGECKPQRCFVHSSGGKLTVATPTASCISSMIAVPLR